jgi:hypothetical protein
LGGGDHRRRRRGAVVAPLWGTTPTPTFPRLALSAYNYSFIGGVLAW